MPTIAGKQESIERVRGTLKMLQHYRAFVRSDSATYNVCRDLQSDWHDMLGRDGAQKRLWFLVNTAINRKVGIPPRSDNVELWRDCQVVQHLIHRNKPSALQWLCYFGDKRRFRTSYIQKRYGYLLKQYDED
jgi:hypothetical protein